MTWSGSMWRKRRWRWCSCGPTGKRRHKACANTAAGHRGVGAVAGAADADGRRARSDSKRPAAIRTRWRSRCTTRAIAVSVLNPQRGRARMAQSQLRRAKTDATDAALIADYVRTQRRRAWTPAPLEARQLQALVRRLDALLEMRTQETQSARAGRRRSCSRPLTATLAHLDEQIARVKRQIADHIDQHPTLRASAI